MTTDVSEVRAASIIRALGSLIALITFETCLLIRDYKAHYYRRVKKVKPSRYTPWRRLGGEEI
jgi:hypothetical protein